MSAGRKTGTVKHFDNTTGFGIITQEDGGEDLSVHRSGIKSGGDLVEGDSVLYVVKRDDSDGRFSAVDVIRSKCYKCGEIGHRASECVNPGGNPTGKVSPIGCWRCSQDTHFSTQCPNWNS